MEVLIFVAIFALILGVLKWLQDTLVFRLPYKSWKTPFSNIKNQKLMQWLNPEISWKNKHEWFKGNKFLTWLISNPFVFITDAWHLIELLRNFLPYILFAFLSDNYFVLLLYLVQIFVFHVLFTYTNKKVKWQ